VSALVLRPDQEEDLAAILATDRSLCANGLGTGKTVLGVEAAKRSGAQRVLVVAPLVTFRGWSKTVASQTGHTLRQISSRKSGAQAFADLADGVAGYYFTGWEYMRTLGWGGVPVDYLILDEVHRVSNRKARQTKVAKTIAAQRVLALSGTPFGNRVEGAWSVLNLLWPSVFPYYWPWVSKYLRTERSAYSRGPQPAGEKEPGIVVASIPSWLRREAPYDIPLAEHEVHVELPPAQLKVYKEFERQAVVWLQENPLIAELPAVKYARLRQLTLAVPSIRYDAEGEPQVYFEPDAKSAKIEALLNVVFDLPEGEPGLVWTASKQFAKIVVDRLKAKGYTAAEYTGDTSRKDRARIEDEFGHTLQFIVATQATAGTGLDGLQLVCRVEHVLSLDDNRVNNDQAWGRLSRGGQERRVNRFLYRAVGTIEEKQVDRLVSDDQLMQETLTTYKQKDAA
jgi:superfamily II DNA or RNA helicase